MNRIITWVLWSRARFTATLAAAFTALVVASLSMSAVTGGTGTAAASPAADGPTYGPTAPLGGPGPVEVTRAWLRVWSDPTRDRMDWITDLAPNTAGSLMPTLYAAERPTAFTGAPELAELRTQGSNALVKATYPNGDVLFVSLAADQAGEWKVTAVTAGDNQ